MNRSQSAAFTGRTGQMSVLRRRRTKALAATLILLTACSDGTGPPAGEPGVQVISGAPRADTIQTRLEEPLRVRVLDGNGRPRGGVAVQFEAEMATMGYEPRPWAWLADPASAAFAVQKSVNSDRDGVAAVRLMLGTRAGVGRLRILVPALGYETVVEVQVLPGAGVAVLAAPSDTVALVGAHVPLRGAVVDRFGNPRSDSVAYAAIDGLIEVAEGRLTGLDITRGSWTVRHGTWLDTGHVTIVPAGEYAAVREFRGSGDTASVVVMTFDGTLRHRFAIENWARPNPDWAPDGSSLVVEAAGAWSTNDHHVLLLGLDGSRRRVLSAKDSVTRQLTPRFSHDGEWIFFTGIPHSVDAGTLPNIYGRQEIWRMKRNGSALSRVGPFASYYKGDWSPAPSRDGRLLAYVTDRAEIGESSVRVLDLNTGQLERFGADRGEALAGSTPIWSPTVPDLLVYGAEHPDRRNAQARRIMAISADGSGRRLVAEGAYRPTFGWSPDGRWILAQSFDHDRLELIEVETGWTLPLPFTGGLMQPSWRP